MGGALVSAHRHAPSSRTEDHGWNGQVFDAGAAAGAIVYEEICECGARRWIAANQGRSADGPWRRESAHSHSIQVWAPTVPGSVMVCQSTHTTMAEAHEAAVERFGDRRDLRFQDVRIEVAGKIVAYVGPSR